ncbi:MAG: conjugal transfer protein TraG, partial [Azospira oryzae]
MQTGENDQALRKIIDLTRICSMVLLMMHVYHFCHQALNEWGYTHSFIYRIMINAGSTGLFASIWTSKLLALLLLIVSLVGARGKKDEKISLSYALTLIVSGLTVFLFAHFLFYLKMKADVLCSTYIVLVLTGYILILTGGTWLSRLIKLQLRNDIFNKLNESFPQEERLLENEYSINLPAQYTLKNKPRRSWINFINPFRALLVIGTPGAGKSYFVIRHIITQHIRKGFSMFIYDFKFDDLSIIAYNTLLKFGHHYPVTPKFYVIDFDKIYHRCNPLDPITMEDITDASESSRTIMLGLNRDWIKKQGDFFVESPINFVTAIIWFLRKYENGKYCTLPHVIE